MTSTETGRRRASENRIKAMGHPLRAAILRILVERTASPAEMARELGEELSNVSYHTKQLVGFECAELVATRPVRGALEHLYRATERHPMQKILDDFVASARAGIVGADKDFHLTRTSLVLDRQGVEEALAAHERARLEILEIKSRSAARLIDSGETGTDISSSQACFQMPSPKHR